MGEVQYLREPENIEAEQSTLGSMLLDKKALAKGLEILTAEDFYRPVHQEIFDALAALGERDEPVDQITLQEELRKREKLDDCGGFEYLMALVDSVPTAKNIEYYANIVKVKANNRRIIATCRDMIGTAMDPAAGDMTDHFVQTALNVSKGGSAGFEHVNGILDGLMTELNNIEAGILPFSVSFKLDALNTFYPQGLTCNDLFIVGAETSQGKSVVLAEIIQSALKDRIPTALITCEMSKLQYIKRLICSEAQVDGGTLHKPGIDFGRVSSGAAFFYDKPFWTFDKTPTMRELEAKVRRWALQHTTDGRGLVVIDYAGLIRREGGFDQENTETARIIKRLKELQRDLELPIATASQFRKRGLGEKKHSPDVVWSSQPSEIPFRTLDDMIGSSEIRNSADKVLILFNPVAARLEDGKRPAYFFNAKNRNGEVGHKAMAWFRPGTTSFHDNTEQWIPEIPPTPEVTFSGAGKQRYWNNDWED